MISCVFVHARVCVYACACVGWSELFCVCMRVYVYACLCMLVHACVCLCRYVRVSVNVFVLACV